MHRSNPHPSRPQSSLCHGFLRRPVLPDCCAPRPGQGPSGRQHPRVPGLHQGPLHPSPARRRLFWWANGERRGSRNRQPFSLHRRKTIQCILSSSPPPPLNHVLGGCLIWASDARARSDSCAQSFTYFFNDS